MLVVWFWLMVVCNLFLVIFWLICNGWYYGCWIVICLSRVVILRWCVLCWLRFMFCLLVLVWGSCCCLIFMIIGGNCRMV